MLANVDSPSFQSALAIRLTEDLVLQDFFVNKAWSFGSRKTHQFEIASRKFGVLKKTVLRELHLDCEVLLTPPPYGEDPEVEEK